MFKHVLLILGLLVSSHLFANDFFDLSAHRGDQAKHTENTLNSLKGAIVNGASSIEFDVHLSKDGVPVVYHDFVLNADSFTNLKEDIPVKDLSFNELKKLRYKDFEKSPFLSLSDLMSSMRNLKRDGYDFLMHMEIKTDDQTNIDQMIKVVSLEIENSKLKERIMVRSFDIDFLYSFKEKVPSVPQVILFDENDIPRDFEFKKLVKDLRPWAVAPHYTDVNQELMLKSGKYKILVLPWTVDDIEVAKKLMKYKVHGITTNFPQNFKKLLKDNAVRTNCFADIYALF